MAFGNPIIGGGDTLVREAIQSEGFVSGSTGWRIERSGDAEFNEITARGEVRVEDADGSFIHIFDEDPGDGAVIDLRPASGTPQPVSARIWTGYTTNNSGHMAPFAQFHGPRYTTQTDEVPSIIFLGRDATATDNRELVLIGTDLLALFADNKVDIHSPTLQMVDVGSRIKRGSIVAPTLLNSWVNFGSGYQSAGYIELPDHTGTLVGVIKDGTAASGTTLFTLPAALRPAAHHVFPATGNLGKTAQIAVESDGDVVLQSPEAGLTWLSLGGCRWPITGF